jgi:hypothetical protein
VGYSAGETDTSGFLKVRLQLVKSTANVSDPPTDAELDATFGAPATVGSGFMGFVDDAGVGSKVWLCITEGTNWWYEELTKAV